MNDAKEDIQASKDAVLVARARAGEPGAFEEIFLRYRSQISSLTFRMTGNLADAEDLCQEVFLQAMRKIGSFQGRSSFSTWLYRVAINRSRDYLRRRKRSPEILTDESEEAGVSAAESVDDKAVGPESASMQSGAQRLVQVALLELPVSLRVPLVLHELEGLQYQEVASLLHLPVGTVKSRIFRARLKMAEILEPHKEHWT